LKNYTLSVHEIATRFAAQKMRYDMEAVRPKSLKLPATILGLGAGVLMGFANSPVVGGVVASLMSGAFVVLSLVPDSAKYAPSKSQVASIPFFVLAIILGAASGLYLRSNSILVPSPVRIDFNQFLEIGVSEEDAIQIIVSKYVGGGEIGRTTGLNAVAELASPARVSSIAKANTAILALSRKILDTEIGQTQKSDLNLIRYQTRLIYAQLRSVIENNIGEDAALLWFNLNTMDPYDSQAAAEMISQNQKEYDKIVEYFASETP